MIVGVDVMVRVGVEVGVNGVIGVYVDVYLAEEVGVSVQAAASVV